MDPLVTQVAENLRQHQLLVAGARLIVAVSGGIDSIVMLDVLQHLAPRNDWELVVAHVNHGLRGRQSEADERFVTEQASRRVLPIRVLRAQVREVMRRRQLSLEVAAREVRHCFLAKVARQRGSRVIALAHHADDQVELFFLRLFRGAGTTGLGGMNWMNPSPADPRVRLIRPFLNIDRKTLADYAQRHGLKWREDGSNTDVALLRNRIRHELLPWLEREYCAGLRAVVLRCMDLLRTDSDFLAQAALEYRRTHSMTLLEAPLALQRVIAREALRETDSAVHFQAVQNWLDTHGQPTPLPSRSKVRFRLAQRQARLKGRGGVIRVGSVAVTWQLRRSPLPFNQTPTGVEQLDADRVGTTLRLRHWQPGDRFQPLGFPCPTKLQDLFVNRKVSADERRQRILATTEEGTVCWVEGFPPGEAFKLQPNTQRILKLGPVARPLAKQKPDRSQRRQSG